MNARTTLEKNLAAISDDAHRLTPEAVLKSAEEAMDSVRDMARKGIEAAAQTSADAHKALNRCASATTRYVADQPVKSALIAAAVGAAVAAIVIAARKRSR